jgi:hypothetical protein
LSRRVTDGLERPIDAEHAESGSHQRLHVTAVSHYEVEREKVERPGAGP